MIAATSPAFDPRRVLSHSSSRGSCSSCWYACSRPSKPLRASPKPSRLRPLNSRGHAPSPRLVLSTTVYGQRAARSAARSEAETAGTVAGADSPMANRVAAVMGVGPGTGLAVAKRFAQGGFHVALLARDKESLEAAKKEVEAQGGKASVIPCDAGAEASVKEALQEASAIGPLEVLVYNASGGGRWPPPKFLETPLDLLQQSLKVNVEGAFVASQQAIPGMLARGKGTIIFTGASAALRGSAGFGAFAAGKFGLRALSQSLAREFGPQGIHVAFVIIDGQIGTPKRLSWTPETPADHFLSPDAIGQAYWDLYSQDKTAWTQEMDLRPYLEKF